MEGINIRIIKNNDVKSDEWSGGVTRQLAIYPKQADYAKRNFGWRISSAEVSCGESSFTPLPGVHRHLMLTDGATELTHKGIRRRVMKPFADVEEFEGAWETSSKGKCSDFNLMTKEGFCGAIRALLPNEKTAFSAPCAAVCWIGLYVTADIAAAELSGEARSARLSLLRGDFVLASYRQAAEKKMSLLVSAKDKNPAVCAFVWQKI